MTKAMLVMDMPKTCEECEMWYETADFRERCIIKGYVADRLKDCPLIPLESTIQELMTSVFTDWLDKVEQMMFEDVEEWGVKND